MMLFDRRRLFFLQCGLLQTNIIEFSKKKKKKAACDRRCNDAFRLQAAFLSQSVGFLLQALACCRAELAQLEADGQVGQWDYRVFEPQLHDNHLKNAR